jgi:hypothetical protein
MGRASNPNQLTWFTERNGGIINTGPSSAYFVLPLVTDGNASTSVTMGVIAPDVNHNVGCALRGYWLDGITWWGNGLVWPSTIGTYTEIVTSINLNGETYMAIDCWMAPTSEVLFTVF